MTTIDFGKALRDAKSASFEALPKGDYDVEVAQADAIRASSGKPMIKVQLSVLYGPYQGRRVFNNFVFSPENAQALSIWFRHMRAFGLKDEFFAQLGGASGLEPVAAALVGRRARITLGIRQWQGEDRNEVNAVKPFTGAPPSAGPTAAPIPPAAPVPTPMAPPPAPAAPMAPPPAAQPGPIATTPAQVMQQAQPAYDAATAQQAAPVIEAAPFDGTAGPIVVPTDAGSTAAAPSPTPPTAPTSEVPAPPVPPAAPALPI